MNRQIKRTPFEIIERIQFLNEKNKIFTEQADDLIRVLDFKDAKENGFLDGREDMTQEKWENGDWIDTPTERISDYMYFAWNKANNHRGLSASRSIEHMKAWVWLDGKDELVEELEKGYCYYGKPLLVKICEEYNIDWKKYDDGEWANYEYETPMTAEEALRELKVK